MSGVPGLARFTVRNGGFSEGDVGLVDYELEHSKVIVDGNSLAWRLIDSRDRKGQDDVDGKELNDCERQVREFFESFLGGREQVIVVIRDEQSEADSQAASATNASGKNIRATLQAPLDMVKMIRSVASEMEFRIETCNGSIYDRVADLSVEHFCPIISDDGYFFRKAPPYGMIPWGSYNCKSRSCELFVLDEKSLLNSQLSPTKLGLINAIVGSSASENEDQQRVLRLIRNKLVFIVGYSACKRVEGEKWNRQMLASVLSHLCGKTDGEVRRHVFDLVAESDRMTAEAIIHRATHDVAFDRTARDLREAIEEVCGCQHHNRVRVAQWIEWLHLETRRPLALSSALFSPLRTKLTIRKLKNVSLSQPQSRENLLRGLHSSAKSYNRHLKLWPGVKANPEDDVVHEFFTVKLLLSALDIESAKRKLPVKFVRATLSCLIYYLGGNNNFLADYRDGLVEEVNHCGYKLRTPLRSISACKPEIFEHMETLIELIWTFNELNSLSGYPMRQLRPEKWLNVCLIYNLTEATGIVGKKLPEEISVAFELEPKPSGKTVLMG